MPDLVADLIELAESLATREKLRPREASLRRAISTAYYALFNRLAELCADELVGWNKPWEVFSPIYRSLDHGYAQKILTERSAEKSHPLGRGVERLGVIFRELQATREWVDYNREPNPDPLETSRNRRFSRQQTNELVANAKKAIGIIDNLEDSTKLALATRLVARPRGKTRS
jgi:hypothetical protein